MIRQRWTAPGTLILATVVFVALGGAACCKRTQSEGNAPAERKPPQQSKAPLASPGPASPPPRQRPAPEAVVVHDTPGLMELLQNIRRRKVSYRGPTPAEQDLHRLWAKETARTVVGGEGLAPESVPPGFEATPLGSAGAKLWVLHEAPGAERGAGIVVLRAGAAAPLMVEAPHTFFDAHTLHIGLAAFEALRARALLINTVHRYGGTGATKPESGDAAADVAHDSRSFYQAAHEGISTALGGLVTVQVHGFRNDQAPGVDAIVSAAGTNAPVDGLLGSLRGFGEGIVVRHYPSQVRVLGGTTNVQARWSAAAGLPFIHLELSHRLRSRLREDEPLRNRFGAALGAVVEHDAR